MSNAGPLATGLALAAVPVVAGIAVYIVKTGAQAKIDGLEGDARRLGEKIEDLQAAKDAELVRSAERYRDLEARYDALLNMRAQLQSQLDVITSSVADLALRLDAADYSVLVPAPTLVPGDKPNELVFLCASGPQGAKLRSVRVPIKTSMSGQVFLAGSATIASPQQGGGAFSRQTDKVAGYQTSETLSACLHYRGEACGVVQFLNRRQGRFGGEDVDRAVEFSRQLSTLVGEFVSDPSRLCDLGYSPRRNDFAATVLYVDLSGYSKLFEFLDNSVVNDILNQYFEVIGDIAIANNGVIDQIIGDAMLIVFGGHAYLRDHQSDAVKASRAMVSAFASLRERWSTIQYHGAEHLFVRLGLSSGPLSRTEVGHRQVRRVTVLGACVNDAALVCERAPRGRDTICVSRVMNTEGALDAVPFDEADCGVFELKI